MPLEQLVLRIKALKYPGTAADVCAKLPEPPEAMAVQRAVTELQDLDALMIDKDGVEHLTPLGVRNTQSGSKFYNLFLLRFSPPSPVIPVFERNRIDSESIRF